MKLYEPKHWPNLYIIGAPKCGTTSMSHYLSGHPQIYMSEEAGLKEPGFFDSDLGIHRKMHGDENAYLNLFKNHSNEIKYQGEATPTYLYSKYAIESILKVSSEAKFIVMLRNPIEIVQALFDQHVRCHWESAKNLKQAWDLQRSRALGLTKLPPGFTSAVIFQYGEFTKLGAQVERLLWLVKRQNVYFVIFDDFKKNTSLIYKDILGFLGLYDDDRKDFEILARRKQYRYPALQKMLRVSSNIRQKMHIKGGWGINAFIDRYNLIETDCSLSKPVDSDFMSELVEFYMDDVELLSNLLGRDLTYWLL